MPSREDYAKIAIARKATNTGEQTYRDILSLNFGVQSATKLTGPQVATLLDIFLAKGWEGPKRPTTVKNGRKGTRRKSDNYIEIQPGPYAKMQRKVLALWNSLGYDVAKLHARCKRQWGIERFEWVKDYHQLHVLITDLEERRG